MALACGGAAFALGLTPAVALTGAALAAVVRALAGESPAALTGAVLAPLLAVASFAEAGGLPARAAVALAAAGWAVTELAMRSDESPPRARFPASLVAAVAAAIATVLDPSFVALLVIAGARPVTTAPPRPRWIVAVPVAGVLTLALAVVAATAWPALGAGWFGSAAHPVALASLAANIGDTLGPVTAVAALAGLALLARPRWAELALAAVVAGAILGDLRAGTVGSATLGLAALLSGLAIARLTAMLRIPSAQAIAGVTIGVLVVMPPAWIALAQAPPAAHTGHASR
jgi:hypothetical protein